MEEPKDKPLIGGESVVEEVISSEKGSENIQDGIKNTWEVDVRPVRSKKRKDLRNGRRMWKTGRQ